MSKETKADARARFLLLLHAAVRDGTLLKLTLGKHRGVDATLRNLFARLVTLKTGPHLTLVWRHGTRDITKNYPPAEALALLDPLIGGDFLDAHLFTPLQTAQLECAPGAAGRLRLMTADSAPPPSEGHDREKAHLIPASAPWLQALGVTNEQGRPREGQAGKFRQINKFVELLGPLLTAAELDGERLLTVTDMGCGKGYLTFGVATLLGSRATVHGIEGRPELVELCNQVAREHGLSTSLTFTAGAISERVLPATDVLIALHACDTATDDALAQGVAAGARLMLVAPCCHKEVRPQLTAPPVLKDALRHGIFQERQAEFVTDALRAALLEWAGYDTKVFEFISTEHTAKNLMITAVRTRPRGFPDDAAAERVRALARAYGVRSQALARQLGLAL